MAKVIFIVCHLISGWDQSDKFVKIYLTLKGVHTIPVENVVVDFKERYVEEKIGLGLFKESLQKPGAAVQAFLSLGFNLTFPFYLLIFDRSFSVLVKDLDGKNHQMTILNLLNPIDAKESCKKVTTSPSKLGSLR